MTVPDWIPALISWLGVVVSFVFSRRAQSASDRANQIQGEILRIQAEAESDRKRQQKQTNWACDLKRSRTRAVLTVECAGPAPAENVEVLVDGDLPRRAGILREKAGHPLRMVKGASLTFTYIVADGSPRIEEVTVKWDDPDKERRTFTTAV